MQKNDNYSFSSARKGRILFSIGFTFVLPICILLFPILTVIFNFLYFPFTLIHELGHLLVITLFLPTLEPQLEFHLLDGEFCCACMIDDEFPLCWQTIIAMLAGSFSVMIFVILSILSLYRMKSRIHYEAGKYYLIFGLFADLPNLLPILPTSLGHITDGFAISTCLYQMGYMLPISSMLSNIFSLFSIVMILTSFFFLGSFLYNLGEFTYIKFGKDGREKPVS
ncbi:MAG: hypothetical protein ACFFC6_09815 [Promethearchaeota archaeon]